MEFNLAQVHEAVEAAVPERECVVHGGRRLSYRDVGDRSRRFANVLVRHGLGDVVDRGRLGPHSSGQDHLAVYLHNGNEHLEVLLGAFKARVVPFNVNHRYVSEELEYLFDDAAARGVVFHSEFAPVLDSVRRRRPGLEVLVQVRDDSGNELLDGAVWYEDALAASEPELPVGLSRRWSPDDLYLLYTGGTTGHPKGVMWRQADIFVAALGGRRLVDGEEWTSVRDIAAAAPQGGSRLLPCPPFSHGAAQWMALNGFTNANTIVIPRGRGHFDPHDVWATVEAEQVDTMLIVGDAFGRPLVEALEAGDHDASSLLVVVNGGATLSPGVKDRLLAAVPTALVLDGLGASESGSHASQISTAGRPSTTGRFRPETDTCVLSSDLTHVVAPGDEVGWLARRGRIPLGYLGDPERSSRTFPEIDGVRYAVPGDRARLHADGTLELCGRDAATINSGGEKVFAEEVEQALLRHPSVADCVVVGRPSPRWGSEVVALVALVDGVEAADQDLLEEAARHIARYKLPKQIVRAARLQRSASGKADYRWAREVAASG